jgi:hypothetical protein
MKRKLPPYSRHHEVWCAIFHGKPCDCDDDDRRERRQRYPPLRGGGAPKQKEKELEDA